MKKQFLSGILCAVSLFTYAKELSWMEVQVDDNDSLSATSEQMSAVDSLVVKGKLTLPSIRSIVNACVSEGSRLKVLDLSNATFPEGRVPDLAFYTAPSPINGVVSADDRVLPRLRLDHIILNRNEITEIGIGAFENVDCPNIDLPYYLELVDDYAFNRSSIKSLKDNRWMGKIGRGAFMRCDGLTSISLGMTGLPTEIDMLAFMGCDNLKNIKLHGGVVSVESDAFHSCPVNKLVLPLSLKEVALDNIGSLESVYSLSFVPPTLIGVMDFTPFDATLYVPEGSAESYEMASGWSRFKYIQEFTTIEEERYISPERILFSPAKGTSVETVSLTFDYMSGFLPVTNAHALIFKDNDNIPLTVTGLRWNDNVNCLMLEADFGGFELNPDKYYRLVLPAGVLMDERGYYSARLEYQMYVNDKGNKSISQLTSFPEVNKDASNTDRLFDLQGRELKEPAPGEPYIKGSKVLVGPK